MGRKLFALVATVSFLLCVAIVASWAISHAQAMMWDRSDGRVYRSITLDSGRIVVETTSVNSARTTTTPWRFWRAPPRNWGGPAGGEGDLLGFGQAEGLSFSANGGRGYALQAWWVPYWFPTALAAVLPAIWTWRRLRPAVARAIARRWPAVAAAPPMRRSGRLLGRASAACLILALATAGLWARSFWLSDSLRFGGPARPFLIWSAGGRLVVNAGVSYESGRTGWRWRTQRVDDDRPWVAAIPGVARRMRAWGDFGYVEGSYPLPPVPGGPPPARERFHMVVFPMWLPAILLALLPAWWFPRRWRAFRARFRAARNLCPRCAYDLRGNTSGICPECGTPAAQVPAA